MKKIISAILALVMMITVIPAEIFSIKASAASETSITGLTATPTDISIKLNWDAVQDKQDKYYIRVYSPDGSYKTLNTDETEITVTDLEYYTDYSFKVITKTSEGYMAWADAKEVTSQMVISERVVGLKAEIKGKGAIITFEPVPDAEGYFAIVYKAETMERHSSIEIADPNATSVTVVNDLYAGQKYIVKITPKLNGQYVAGVKENGVGVAFTAPIVNPSAYTIADQTATSLRFNWSAVRGVSEYFIRVKEKETGNPVRTIHTTGGKTTATLNRYTDGTKLSPNTTYTLEFCAYLPNMELTYSAPIDITTGDYEKISIKAEHNKETNAVNLSWNSTTNAVGYFIYRTENGVRKYIKYIEGKDNTSFLAKLPQRDGDYSFSIIAYEKNSSGTCYTPVTSTDIITIGEKLSYTPVDTEGMTDLQKALVITAESYVLRGNRAQYEDTRFCSTMSRDIWRWNFGSHRSPEAYTAQDIGYSNCAAFTHDIYYNALDYDIVDYSTAQLTSRTTDVVLTQTVSSTWTEEEIEAKKQEFIEALQPGDLMVYRYTDGNGHVMMYVGNGMMIHCIGSNYDWTNKVEKYEATGSFTYESYDCLFDATHRRYLFNKKNYRIVRPLLSFTGEIPEKTLDRMEDMRCIVAEKLASHSYAKTVNTGEEITYTFSIKNLNESERTLNITDTVPANTTYVTGAQNFDGTNLSWTVTVPAKSTVTVSYRVKVKEDAASKKISSSSFIEDVPLNCADIHVANTLTAEKQKAISDAVSTLSTSELTGIELADAIYTEALGASALTGETAETLIDGVYQNFSTNLSNWPGRWQRLMTSGNYIKMLAPHLYGGRQVLETGYTATTDRTRLVTEELLVAGDIIILNNSNAATDDKSNFAMDLICYLYTGDKLLDLSTNTLIDPDPTLESVIAYYHFAVLRPSMVM